MKQVVLLLGLGTQKGCKRADRQPEHRHRYKAQCDSLWLFGVFVKCTTIVYCTLNTVLRVSRSSVALEGNFYLFKLPFFTLAFPEHCLCCIPPLLSPLFTLLWDKLCVELVTTAVISKVFEFCNRLSYH